MQHTPRRALDPCDTGSLLNQTLSYLLMADHLSPGTCDTGSLLNQTLRGQFGVRGRKSILVTGGSLLARRRCVSRPQKACGDLGATDFYAVGRRFETCRARRR